ncbi:MULTISPECIES: flavodoxin [Dethiosulfovibrio]|uniref:Flavodoxin n=2 Tax=Dethiosulfovibrio TaxID=47054 RepID=A0ABS9EMJ9_9BACT|nr:MULTISPECIES: flavodoxin [Dethiosulfovibrio]MCF4114897.1 flavodoxin [Dethiosulfovibrio russensis]MCF4142418.1 flavodoxin [Dethiosulfovibrio marinus]MCF4145389.1 flavodoxin [Dethiosulfovibrio acidaminovorans]MCF4152635.1 flavodoxin [Dethiosulfovibrio faecalis]
MNEKKALVAFFSATGVTAKIAEKVAKVVEGDLFEIVPAEPYTKDDLNWHDGMSRSSLEMNDRSSRPEIAHMVDGMERYETIFIGFPIWWYVAPRIIQTFLESYDFSGKKISLFATSGMSGMGDTQEILRLSCPGAATWGAGRRFSESASESEINRWVGKSSF